MCPANTNFFAHEEGEEIPPEKVAILFVGGNAIDCIKRLADTDHHSSPEYKTGVGKVKTNDVSYILRDGTSHVADNNDLTVLNKYIRNYQAIIFCPTDKDDLNKYSKLLYDIPDKVTRIMSNNPDIKDIAGKNLFLTQPSSDEARIKILSELQSDINSLSDDLRTLKRF